MDKPNHVYPAMVISVHDGDTFWAQVDVGFYMSARLKIRVLNLWAPELDEPGGQASLEFLRGLIEGQQVSLQTMKDEQTFDRWLADVVYQGLDVAKQSILSGFGFRTKKEEQAWLKTQFK